MSFTSSIPIFTYHSLDESGAVTSTAPTIFQKQMEHLWRSGYRALSLATVVEMIRREERFPERTFVLTFDDGYKNVYTHAFPVLQNYGFSGTVFLITDYCGKMNDWAGHSPAVARRPLVSWAEVREMSRHGVEFGSHTATHPDVSILAPARAEQEIRSSKKVIEDKLGVPVTTFAYPYGKYNAPVRQIVKRHFRGACSTKLGKARVGSDPYLLKRIDMYYLNNFRIFSALSTNAFDWYMSFRHLLRELKMRIS
jgi:peptidoglycan/xylan/chitin deacetylase (PgdA/CDA1 family)